MGGQRMLRHVPHKRRWGEDLPLPLPRGNLVCYWYRSLHLPVHRVGRVVPASHVEKNGRKWWLRARCQRATYEHTRRARRHCRANLMYSLILHV